MKFVAVVIGILLANPVVCVRAQQGIPRRSTLAEMGLSGMQILSDREASVVRVHAFPPSRWGDLYYYVHGVSRLDRDVRRSRRPMINVARFHVMVRH